MINPGFYYMNPYSVIYGPNYNVRPPYPPFQGAILGPKAAAQYCPPPAAPGQPYMYSAPAAGAPQGIAFPRHLYARSPRDFFMVETDPRSSPYTYGYINPAPGPTGIE
jgi:hypothetical protein